MKIHDVVQGTSEWFDARTGIPTVSNLGKILTEKRLDYSASAPKYAAELIGERLLGKSFEEDDSGNVWTSYGQDTEEKARRWYAYHKDAEVQTVGFVTTDDGSFGGSPDALVDDDGLLEIKCRSLRHHMRSIATLEEIADRLQVQGYLWLTDRKWIDVVAYNPVLPKKIVRTYPDPAVQRAIEAALERFAKDLETTQMIVDGIAGDVIEDDNLKALLAASLQKPTTDKRSLNIDEMEELREDMDRAEALGLWGAEDRLGMIRDIEADDWKAARELWRYLKRLLESEAVPS